MSDEPRDPSGEIPIARRLVLPYRAAVPTSAVTLRTFYDPIEAQLSANELAAHDIEYFLMNQNAVALGIPYSGFSQVELQVREADAAEATQILRQFQVNPLEVEPEDDADPQQPVPDPSGGGSLVAAGAYENPRDMYDAAALLGASHIESFLPSLVPRKGRPAGTGKRFVLRVREEDAERAKVLLGRAEAERGDEDEPRCPQCGSYRVQIAPRPWPGLVAFMLGKVPRSPRNRECLRCKHRWPIE